MPPLYKYDARAAVLLWLNDRERRFVIPQKPRNNHGSHPCLTSILLKETRTVFSVTLSSSNLYIHIITASVKLICIMLTVFCCRQLTAYTPCNVKIIRLLGLRIYSWIMIIDGRCVETVMVRMDHVWRRFCWQRHARTVFTVTLSSVKSILTNWLDWRSYNMHHVNFLL